MAIANDDCRSSFDETSTLRADLCANSPARTGQFRARVLSLNLKNFRLKKRHYLVLVSRDENGRLRKVPVPLHFAYAFVVVAVVGAFTVAGLAGSF